ncbi:MAG: glycine--tRNA ligase subunit beta [Novosphingobium sp.]
MSDFLLELRSEEIPARMQAGARADLEKLFRKEMADAGLSVNDLTIWSTPRRLALIARDLPVETAAISEEVKGPATSAPEQALAGFLGKVGLTKDQLEIRDVKGKDTWFAVMQKPGRPVREVLADAIPAIIRAFPWPKSQRWGAASISTESLRWVRPLSGIVAIFGNDLVECEVGGIRSGYATRGHRFHCPGEVTIGSADDYQDKLRACHVIVDHEERQRIIHTGAERAAQDAGLVLVEDQGLVIENAGLTEWPVPLLGRFDPEFLEVPPEVIQLTARTNQKYFICRDKQGKLANAFVCTANIAAADGGEAIVAGNRKVLAARLSDARFFWDQDRKKTLEQHANGLTRITFHEKLGTVADKVKRVNGLAGFLLANSYVPNSDEKAAEIAAELCKSDLVSEMVGEFPELQGLMGGYYARAEGLPDAVADAIRDHYKPVGQGDDVPTAPVTVAVSLADKLDTLAGFFAIDEQPTGSKDPYALRRAAISAIRLILENNLRIPLRSVVNYTVWWVLNPGADTDQINEQIRAVNAATRNLKAEGPIGRAQVARMFEELRSIAQPTIEKGAQFRKVVPQIVEFITERLKVQQREAGARHDLIAATFALTEDDDLVRLLARVHALQAFIGTEDGANLLAGYKRAANILKKEDFAETALSYTPEPAEAALIAALDVAEPRAAAAIAAEDFASAMAALASLRAPIDAFFEDVTVNDADPAKRAARLTLLGRFRAAVHNVADFSKIEG